MAKPIQKAAQKRLQNKQKESKGYDALLDIAKSFGLKESDITRVQGYADPNPAMAVSDMMDFVETKVKDLANKSGGKVSTNEIKKIKEQALINAAAGKPFNTPVDLGLSQLEKAKKQIARKYGTDEKNVIYDLRLNASPEEGLFAEDPGLQGYTDPIAKELQVKRGASKRTPFHEYSHVSNLLEADKINDDIAKYIGKDYKRLSEMDSIMSPLKTVLFGSYHGSAQERIARDLLFIKYALANKQRFLPTTVEEVPKFLEGLKDEKFIEDLSTQHRLYNNIPLQDNKEHNKWFKTMIDNILNRRNKETIKDIFLYITKKDDKEIDKQTA